MRRDEERRQIVSLFFAMSAIGGGGPPAKKRNRSTYSLIYNEFHDPTGLEYPCKHCDSSFFSLIYLFNAHWSNFDVTWLQVSSRELWSPTATYILISIRCIPIFSNQRYPLRHDLCTLHSDNLWHTGFGEQESFGAYCKQYVAVPTRQIKGNERAYYCEFFNRTLSWYIHIITFADD